MSTRVPSFFMLVPGPWASATRVVDGAQEALCPPVLSTGSPIEEDQIRVQVVTEAEGFGAFVSWGPRGELPAEVVAEAAGCSQAALIEVGGYLHERASVVLSLGEALRDQGGVCVRMEASGGACTWEHWADCLRSGQPWDLFRVGTVLASGEEGRFFTYGVQEFGLPDAAVDGLSPRDAATWLELLCGYELENGPVLSTGHTFGGDEHGGKRRVERWPDHRHSPSDGRHNPFGLWRATKAELPGLTPESPQPVLMPSLLVLLAATERKKARALLESEVAELLDGCPAIAMAPADVRDLERSRGYADLEPRLAWEQWQLIREPR